MTVSKYKDALEDMVWQFAYRGSYKGKPSLGTGGLSALENAFATLGWSDPKIFDLQEVFSCICDVEGCMGWVVSQGGNWPETGYWCVCAKHSVEAHEGKPQPEMKDIAMQRERLRDKEKCLPLDWQSKIRFNSCVKNSKK